MKRRLVLAIALVALLAAAAAARPGGGDTFNGGGGHGGGDSGGSGLIGELIYWLFRIIFQVPQIGIPILLIVIGYFIYSAYKRQQNKDWDSGPPVTPEQAIELDAVRRIDPDFSQVTFEDFVFRLFSEAHRKRHSADALATLAPYLEPAARTQLAAREPIGVAVQQVIVGALRVSRVDLGDQRTRVAVELEANVATAEHTYYSVESWLLGRAATVRTKPPGVRTFNCPNCGAPWQAAQSGTEVCASCNEAVANGRFDWTVEQVSLASIDERPPSLTAEVPERGTDLPTYRQRDANMQWIALNQADPQLSQQAVVARLEMIYQQLYAAWSNNDLRPIRGLVSDGLYDYLGYWIDAYKQQGLRNPMLEMRITETSIAKITRDRWYDAITIRIWATGKDFVIHEPGGEHVRGSRHRDRPYSEYWTLIRSAARKGPTLASPSCGNCGAPLVIGQAGECEHCGAHVTAGEFDWVLSKIEQDDTYRG